VLFLLIHLTLKIVISKIKPPLQVVIIAATKKKNRKKNQIQFYTYISILVVMTKRKKKHLFLGTLIHTKKTVIVSLSHFT